MDQSRSHPPYVLITPARNEEAFIEKTIEAVTRQTVLPIRWVIVDDGSTDGTAEVVRRRVARYPWIEMLQMPPQDRKSTRLNSSHTVISYAVFCLKKKKKKK